MTYSPPPFADFTARFPSFAAVSEDTYALWSADAATITGAQEACLGDRIDLATMYLTAHYLTLVGLGTGAEAEFAAQGASGFKSIKSGSLSLERGDSAPSGGEYGKTSWGARFWSMISPCLAGPRITGTGAVVGGCGYNGWAGPLPPWGR